MMKKTTVIVCLLAICCLSGCGPVGAAVNTTANVAIGVASTAASLAVGAVTAII